MNKLENISLFKITILIVINIFLSSWLILFLSIIYLILDGYKSFLVFLIIFILITLANIKSDFISVGIVDEVNSKYVIVDKLLYKTKVYNTDYEIGDIVKTCDNSSLIEEINSRKYNTLFVNYGKLEYIGTIITRSYTNSLINNCESAETINYYKKILLNDYVLDNNIDYLGYGFSFYYLLLIILRKDRRITSILLLLYIVFFGFQTKFFLTIIDIIIYRFKFDSKTKICIKVLIVLLINKYLLLSYTILISLIYTLILNSEFNNRSYLFILQSLLFNQIQPLNCLIYRYLIKIRISIFIISLISLTIKPLQTIYTNILDIYIRIMKPLSFQIRGKFSILVIIFLFILFKKINIKNDYLKCAIICVILILPLSNPFLHVNFINVGQGDATLIHGPFNSCNILIDTGSKYNYSKLKRSLYEEGVYKLDYLIISHNDEDHSGNIDNLKDDFDIQNIITEGKDINIGSISLKYLDLGLRNSDNDSSLVYMLYIDNYQILFTGDISKNVENILINDFGIRNIDVLKVAHHGSKYSTSSYFISNLLPKLSIISTSGLYDHPSDEVLEVLNSYLVRTYITKDSGNIKIYFTKLIDILKTDKNECYIMS